MLNNDYIQRVRDSEEVDLDALTDEIARLLEVGGESVIEMRTLSGLQALRADSLRSGEGTVSRPGVKGAKLLGFGKIIPSGQKGASFAEDEQFVCGR